ncbi:MAG: PEP-CTERM system TPR-repeat protein PrsT [Acetobacteraceae bacterium]|nr:PEP-CTERM system TPR-repeat protein PrsT [Acetobacteraceae bacterium]
MTKKTALLAGTVAVILCGGGAGAWYVLHQNHDPMVMARDMMAHGDVRGAGLELRNAVRDQPENAEAHFRLAEIQLAEGDPIAAEREARLARRTGYDAAAANQLTAQALLRQGKDQALLDEFKPDGLAPAQAVPLLVMRALAQLRLQNNAAASASIAEAERIAPNDPGAALAAARIAAAQHDYVAAEQDVDRALKLAPKSVDALLLKGQLANAKGDRKAALAAFDAALAAAPNSTVARLERANIYMLSNEDAKSRADVDAVLKAEPRNAPALYLRAVLLIRAKDFKAANDDLERITPVIDRFPRGLYFLAVDKAALGDAAQAADAAEKYAARFPKDLEGLKLLARIDLSAKQPDPVIRALAPAATAGTADAEVLDLLGRAYALEGETPLAVQVLQHASDLAPQNAEILTHLASSRLQLGDASGAAGTLERSLQMQPGQADAQRVLVIAAIENGNLDQAQAALDKLRSEVGDTEAVGSLAGTIRLARFDLSGAEQQFRAVVEKFPQSVPAKLNLARALAVEDKREDAEGVLEGALKQDPANTAALGALTNLLLQQGQASRAAAAVEAAHEAAPANEAITAALSELYVRAGDPKKALALLDQVGTTLPPPLLAARAQAQFAAGDQDGARQTWRDLLTLRPQNVEVRRLLVSALVRAKKFDEARSVVQEGLSLSPGNPVLLATSVAVAQAQGGMPAGLAEADRLRKDPANVPAASLLKGDVLMANRRFGEAAAAYQAEYKQAPSLALALRAADALQASGASAAAAQQLDDWLKRQPDSPDALRLLASLEMSAGQYAEAEPKFLQVLKLRPNDPVALNNLAWSLQEQGKPDALGYARRAFLAAPTPDIADTLGWILASHGEAADALPLLRQAAKAKPQDPSVQYHLALALSGTGQKGEAIHLLDALVGRSGSFTDKPKAQALLDQLKTKP